MDTVKLLVCYHKPAYLLKDEILTPIHVGRALAGKRAYADSEDYKWLTGNMIGDDTGDNISDKNNSYNEMTSLYWAWKNYDKLGSPDYIGLMHYRRHFILRPGELDVIHFDRLDERTYFDEINYTPEKMYSLVEGCDFITHIGKVDHVYRHYLENHRKEDLDTALGILYELYPAYKETAGGYLEGNQSNFCNMFIFSRKLFFEYCEWIFSILEEFENRVDISGKRLFISERLTGIYIAKLMKEETLKYKVLPISFIAEQTEIPLVMPYGKEFEFQIAVTLISLLKNKGKSSKYAIYMLCGPDMGSNAKERFEKLVSGYAGGRIQFVETKLQPEYYLFVAAELFPDLKKCIWITEDVLVLKDLAEFYRICSVDDYDIVGAPAGDYDIFSEKKEVQLDFLVMNLARLRQTALYRNAAPEIKGGVDAGALFNKLCRDVSGYVPWYYMTAADTASDGMHLFDRKKTRGQLQADALWKPILLYGESVPWKDPQNVFSLFWWEMASFVPACFSFPALDENVLKVLFARQQQEINEVGTMVLNAGPVKQPSVIAAEPEDWRKYSLIGKLGFYYRHNGFKNTMKYCCRKYILREKELL